MANKSLKQFNEAVREYSGLVAHLKRKDKLNPLPEELLEAISKLRERSDVFFKT